MEEAAVGVPSGQERGESAAAAQPAAKASERERDSTSTAFASASQQITKPKKRKKSSSLTGSRRKKKSAPSGDDDYYVVEKIVAVKRDADGVLQCKLRWQGWSANADTWEPASSLNECLLPDLYRMLQEQENQQVNDDNNEVIAVGGDSEEDKSKDSAKMSEATENVQKKRGVASDPWTWDDKDLLKYRAVQRIGVNDPDARDRVTEARENGIPVVLVGHKGWANFAHRWLRAKRSPATESNPEITNSKEWLDLKKNWEVDVERMIAADGEELVPILRPEYNEQKPIEEEDKWVPLKSFLQSSWPSEHSANVPAATKDKLYLHQWQFPHSETAKAKLCGGKSHNPLPDDILGEDLLCYYLEVGGGQTDNPYQYVFMGADGTMSKIHQDRGGLDITIAPVVGIKEVLMVHRRDGPACLYHLEANLDELDLRRFPLTCQARVWKTSVQPGEILLMPQGTYHDCRNSSPCLAYSRLHLDTVNIMAFMESMFNGDAAEIPHDKIIWNACKGLRDRLDAFVESSDENNLSPGILRIVKTLMVLKQIGIEIARRYQTKHCFDPHGKGDHKEKAKAWGIMVDDIRQTLHEMRYRRTPKSRVPKFIPSFSGKLRNAELNKIEKAFKKLPVRSQWPRPCGGGRCFEGSQVQVKLFGKYVEGIIEQVEINTNAAFLQYEQFSKFYNEYQPYHKLREPRAGEQSVQIRPQDIKPDKIVTARVEDTGEEYKAKVLSCKHSTFYSVSLKIGEFNEKRWLAQDDIYAIGPPERAETPTDSLSSS